VGSSQRPDRRGRFAEKVGFSCFFAHARQLGSARKSFTPMKIQNIKEALQATNANLSKSEFNDVNLQEATFTNINLSKATFTDINFSGAKFSNLNLTNVEIEACETRGMKFRGVLVSDLFEAYRRKTSQ
jgi:uncharacterized protein YjbI with pentapeptide repeats